MRTNTRLGEGLHDDGKQRYKYTNSENEPRDQIWRNWVDFGGSPCLALENNLFKRFSPAPPRTRLLIRKRSRYSIKLATDRHYVRLFSGRARETYGVVTGVYAAQIYFTLFMEAINSTRNNLEKSSYFCSAGPAGATRTRPAFVPDFVYFDNE